MIRHELEWPRRRLQSAAGVVTALVQIERRSEPPRRSLSAGQCTHRDPADRNDLGEPLTGPQRTSYDVRPDTPSLPGEFGSNQPRHLSEEHVGGDVHGILDGMRIGGVTGGSQARQQDGKCDGPNPEAERCARDEGTLALRTVRRRYRRGHRRRRLPGVGRGR
jgi:hypothetical protein